MYTVSARFLGTLRGPQRVSTLVEGAYEMNGPWTELSYPVSSGSVSISRTGTARRTLDMQLTQVSNRLKALKGELSPYYGFIRVKRGLVYPNRAVERVPLGVFRIHDVKITSGGTAQITGYSTDKDLADNRLFTPYVSNGGPTLRSHTVKLIQGSGVTAPISWDSTLWNPSSGPIIFEKDRRAAIDDLCSSAGGEVSAAANGVIKIRPPGDITQPPVWYVDVGENGVLIEYTSSYSRTGVYNGIVVSNEEMGAIDATATAEPIRVLVVDAKPLSPTFWDGAFGRKPRFYTSQFIKSHSQAVSAGKSLLKKERGLSSSFDFNIIPNPALDVDDVIMAVYEDGTMEPHLIDSLTIGIGADTSMTGATRAIQDVSEF